ncbi:hypothetical protein AMK59_5613 [Oryctes borbonicus]|uniref:Uncharacterized protein n=1 Tax=Oryctes borbonicus TaxID=1629725 RepID=A0A0T6B2U3_9SCAR|nr:hypothetical protein AMK59_5613 [Oryctes borbonicus]
MNSCLVYFLIVSLFDAEVEPLRCWKCKSNSANDCGDPFLKSAKSTNSSLAKFDIQKATIYSCKQQFVPFNYPTERIKPMCMKRVEIIGDEKYYSRLCTFMPTNQLPANKCPDHEVDNPYAVVEYCEICFRDLCNRSSILKYTISTIIVVSANMLLLYQ